MTKPTKVLDKWIIFIDKLKVWIFGSIDVNKLEEGELQAEVYR